MVTRFGTKIGARAVFLTAVIGAGASPVLADCCDSFLGCAATVVTYGLSCEIETIIDTVKNLVNAVSNLKDLVTNTTNSAVQAARNSVTSTHDSIQSQAQQGSANMTAALAQATTIAQEEPLIRHLTAVEAQPLQPTGSAPSQGATATIPTARLANKPVTAAAAAPTSNTANSMQRIGVGPSPSAATDLITTHRPPAGAFNADFALAVNQIKALQGASAPDLPNITQNLQKALQTEGVGEQNAVGFYSTAINAPLDSVKNLLLSILSDPAKAFDPSDQVTTVEDSVVSQLTKNVGTMVDDVVSGPNIAFAALQPSLDDLTNNSQNAQAIAAAMEKMYTERTPASVAALHALLPKPTILGQNKTALAAVPNSSYAARSPVASMTGQIAAVKQKAIAAIAPQVQQFNATAVRFKAQYAQRKSVQSPSMLQAYQSKLTQQTSAAFDGKSVAAVNAQRDQLIAQARTVYAKDTKTQNSLIAWLNTEAAKRTGNANASVATPANAAMPTVAATALTSSPTTAAKAVAPRQVTAVAPQAVPLVPSAGPIAAPITAAPASSTPRATAWGSAPPAWTPPVSNSANKPPVAIPALGAVRTVPGTAVPVQSAQPLKPASAAQPPPSSLTSH
jgi:hypothetical protein